MACQPTADLLLQQSLDPLSDACLRDCVEHSNVGMDAGANRAMSATLDVYRCFHDRCAAACSVEDWSCLEGMVDPKPSGAAIQWYMQVLSYATPLANVDVEECARSDTDCVSPTRRGRSDTNGNVSLPVDLSGNVYFDLIDPEARIHELLVFPPFLTHSQSTPAVGIWPPLQDPGLGWVLVAATSCGGGSGLTVAITPAGSGTQYNYVKNGSPSPTETCTDVSGNVGILNVPPGIVTIEARRCGTNEFVGSVAAIVRAGAQTQVAVGAYPQ